jgi:hypothetical protein
MISLPFLRVNARNKVPSTEIAGGTASCLGSAPKVTRPSGLAAASMAKISVLSGATNTAFVHLLTRRMVSKRRAPNSLEHGGLADSFPGEISRLQKTVGL